MKITDSAKEAFKSEMERQNFDSIRMFVDSAENGQVLKLEIQNNEDNLRSIDVNGLNVIIDEELEAQLATIKFDFNGYSLEMVDESVPTCSSGGCAGCSSGCC